MRNARGLDWTGAWMMPPADFPSAPPSCPREVDLHLPGLSTRRGPWGRRKRAEDRPRSPTESVGKTAAQVAEALAPGAREVGAHCAPTASSAPPRVADPERDVSVSQRQLLRSHGRGGRGRDASRTRGDEDRRMGAPRRRPHRRRRGAPPGRRRRHPGQPQLPTRGARGPLRHRRRPARGDASRSPRRSRRSPCTARAWSRSGTLRRSIARPPARNEDRLPGPGLSRKRPLLRALTFRIAYRRWRHRPAASPSGRERSLGCARQSSSSSFSSWPRARRRRPPASPRAADQSGARAPCPSPRRAFTAARPAGALRADAERRPTQPRFSGSTRILVSIPAPTQYLVLHGRNIDVKRAVARIRAPRPPQR